MKLTGRFLCTVLLAGMLIAAACGGDRSSAPVATPCPTEEPSPPAASSSSAVSLSSAVFAAEKDLVSLYVRPLDSTPLLAAAWRGTLASLQALGIVLPAGVEPSITGTASERERAYNDAFNAVNALVRDPSTSLAVTETALTAMAASLNDDHTAYVPRALWEADLKDEVLSPGFSAAPSPQGLVVTEVVPGSPAEAAGLVLGDAVVAVNGRPVPDGFNVRRLDPTRPVSLTVAAGPKRQSAVELHLRSAPHSWLRSDLLDDRIGYVRLYEFPSVGSCDDFADFRTRLDSELASLKKRGARAWLLDLRGNPGGSVLAASYLAGRLGYEGLFLTARDRDGVRTPLEAMGSSAIGHDPFAILVDGASASSSEVVSYDLMEDGRAKVVGVQTSGKVAIGRAIPVGDGALQVTVALVDAGSNNRVLEKSGVVPDLRADLDLGLLTREGRDSQLEAALDYLKQKLGR